MGKGTASLIAVGAFIVGSLVGFSISLKFFDARLHAYQWADVDRMSTYVMMEHFLGTPRGYEAALQEFLAALTAWERSGSGTGGNYLSPNALFVDRAMTYGRLALLAAERNDSNAAAKYWSQALALCPKIGWTTSCSVDGFTLLIHSIDDHSYLNPKRPSTVDHGS